MFEAEVEKIKTHILCPITFFPESRAIYEMWGKYGTFGKATDNNIIWRMRTAT